jgi:hypothetical protein
MQQHITLPPFKGSAGVGMGVDLRKNDSPIPLLTSPLKGEEIYMRRM